MYKIIIFIFAVIAILHFITTVIAVITALINRDK